MLGKFNIILLKRVLFFELLIFSLKNLCFFLIFFVFISELKIICLLDFWDYKNCKCNFNKILFLYVLFINIEFCILVKNKIFNIIFFGSF